MLPQLKESIPLVILFRALGCVSDKAILSKICFDCPDDADISEVLRSSLEEAKTVETEEEALDYIAKRGNAQAYIKENRLSYSRLILEGEFLPHVSTRPNDV